MEKVQTSRPNDQTSQSDHQKPNQNNKYADVDFKFTLRDLLLESPLYVCLYEDVPFKAAHSASSLSSSSSTSTSSSSSNSIEQIKQLFFANIAASLNKIDSSGSTTKTYDFVINSIRNDLIKILILKLNDIKINSSADFNFIKQLVDYLSNQLFNNFDLSSSTRAEQAAKQNEQFKCYLKFNNEATANCQSTSAAGSNKLNSRSANVVAPPAPVQLTRYDCLENKFFVYGLFFLNNNNSISQTAGANLKSGTASSVDNKLVFFLFNCEPESIKYSLINSQANTYLIRKYLFAASSSATTSKTPQQQPQKQHKQQKKKNTNALADCLYKFYFSKNSVCQPAASSTHHSTAHSSSSSPSSSLFNNKQSSSHFHQDQTATAAASSSNKYLTMSDILKENLSSLKAGSSFRSGNNSVTPVALITISSKLLGSNSAENNSSNNIGNNYLLNYIDYIEQCCAKSYISSLVHFIGVRAIERAMPSLEPPTHLPAVETTIVAATSPPSTPNTPVRLKLDEQLDKDSTRLR